MQAAIFLDRDGVIIENRDDYVKCLDEVRFLPGALSALQQLGHSSWTVVEVTNQSVVGRGVITIEQAQEINEFLVAEIKRQGGRIDAAYMCPHHPRSSCCCRKPAPGMLLQAAEQLGLDLSRSYLVGDGVSDILAAQAVGVRGIMVLSGRGQEQAKLLPQVGLGDCPVMPDLHAAVEHILARERIVEPVGAYLSDHV
jgi:D-glycero-D-manno-heptose 1,7-bisphosphate phosphatase